MLVKDIGQLEMKKCKTHPALDDTVYEVSLISTLQLSLRYLVTFY